MVPNPRRLLLVHGSRPSDMADPGHGSLLAFLRPCHRIALARGISAKHVGSRLKWPPPTLEARRDAHPEVD